MTSRQQETELEKTKKTRMMMISLLRWKQRGIRKRLCPRGGPSDLDGKISTIEDNDIDGIESTYGTGERIKFITINNRRSTSINQSINHFFFHSFSLDGHGGLVAMSAERHFCADRKTMSRIQSRQQHGRRNGCYKQDIDNIKDSFFLPSNLAVLSIQQMPRGREEKRVQPSMRYEMVKGENNTS